MIKVLIVDDSAIVRQILSAELSKARDIEVIGVALDAYVARDKIISLRPDVVTLDVEMPKMDGLTFLGKLMKHHPLPVIVVSSLTPEGGEAAMRALELGAVDVMCKPNSTTSLPDLSLALIDRIRAAASARTGRHATDETPDAPQQQDITALSDSAHKIIAIGASTGGTVAIEQLLRGLPANTPGIVIVQHMPRQFTASFADRLNGLCPMEVREAKHHDAVTPGLALIAPGDQHMVLRRAGDGYRVQIKGGPLVHHQRPSIDVLFHSVARTAGSDAVGVLLTGMGSDGAKALLAMREAGAATLVQDEQSCVVFGIPKEAIRLGAAEAVLPLSRIPRHIVKLLARRAADTPA